MISNKLKPNHIAIIMDGNGRWAIDQGLDRSAGHLKGYENIKPTVIAAKKLGIKHLTIFAFSTETGQDHQKKLNYIKSCYRRNRFETDELNKNGVKIRHIGSKKSPKKYFEKNR